MPFCFTHQFRLTSLTICSALAVILFGAPSCLQAQQDNRQAQQFDSSVYFVDSSTLSPDVTPSFALELPPAHPPAAELPVAELPDSPGALQNPQSAATSSSAPQKSTDNPDAVSPNGNQQTKRVLGIVPNFNSVSADIKLPPQTVKEKFTIAAKNSFDYSSFIIVAIQSGISMSSKSYPEFHQGAAGYARYYWHTLADTADENFFVSGIGPVVFRQDNRFYTLGHGSFGKRSWYAVTRVLVTRKDNGNETFNFSEVVGSGAAAGVGSLYYPSQYRTWTKVGQRWLTSDLIDCFNFGWKEWWPTANKYVFHTH